MNRPPEDASSEVTTTVPDAVTQALHRALRARVEQMQAGGASLESEAAFLHALGAHDDLPLPLEAMQRFYRELFSATRALSAPPRVAYLGPEGTYTHAAVEAHFGHAITALPEGSIPDVFGAVEHGRAAFGVVPVENSTEGSVNHTLDLLASTALRICGEVRVRIQHCVMSRAVALDDITHVHAHPQSLAQCRGWLDAHLPEAERISESSNAAAAERVRGMPTAAAIASLVAAERYGMNVLERGIEDVKTNTTRFLVMGDRDLEPTGHDATSLLCSAPHRPGGLRQMLEPFESAGVSLTRIESRPARGGLWQYVFYIDVTGHQHDDTLAPVLARLRHALPLMRVLGSYPRVT